MKELELYIHIPFCVKKCNYCDFLSAPADEKSQSAYMEALKKEVSYYGKQFADREISTIFIGGGTPSWVKASYIEDLMREIYASFTIAKDAEISMECNPGTVTKEKLEIYKNAGINRLSMGLQSADDEELKNLGRIHTFEQFLENFNLARECGFTNINIDLMHGLPKQTVEKARETLEKVIALNPEHISSYSLIIEEGTPFFDWYKEDLILQENGETTKLLPKEDTLYQIEKMSQKYLAEHGYIRYEISNYAKKGFRCEHNIGYWQRKDYLGLGLGAASLIENVRYSNIVDIEKYIMTVCSDCKAIREENDVLDKKAQMEECMFLGLRMLEGVSKNTFAEAYGNSMEQIYGDVITKLEQEKLLINTADRIYLTDKGIDVSNYVLAHFLF
ncbi:MAG: oxygen-independent coproporphyrinogen III oxidase [Lachnospiraceae bacterium]|nr:oxygen-independent coproporphyrinogen III oxidase [Lachnospiraceae bacterium]